LQREAYFFIKIKIPGYNNGIIKWNFGGFILLFRPQNLIAQSQSGTGKTAAFVLAMLSRVDPSQHYPQVLCLSPTYELAIQTGEVVKAMAQFCPEISVVFAVRQETSKCKNVDLSLKRVSYRS